MSRLPRMLTGSGIFARVLRGSAITAGSYAFAQLLRLASNLILTRLLYPEAFGLMALVSVFMVGLMMFSDVGLGASISQNKRGDDPDFLNTAWTIQVARGALLFLAMWALAWPAAQFFRAPDLAVLLPAVGLTLLTGGFAPTRIDTAHRHLMLGRVTLLDLASQAIGIVSMVLIAWVWPSVWALVIGQNIGTLSKLWLVHMYLPGPKNRFQWEPAAGRELIHFGKWIFLSTACGFLLFQGDKAILGAYMPLDQLGIYNIGYFLASFPVLLAQAVAGRVLIPLYRDSPPSASARNFARLRRLRCGLTAGVLALLALLALGGVPLVDFLYDARYAQAGAILVVVACAQMPLVIGMTYDQAALAAGDSRNFFWVVALKATVQTATFLTGVHFGGLLGGLAAQGLTWVLVYPAVIWIARRHGAWDALHDLGFAALALLAGGTALALNWSAVLALAG
ncbi:oligosaccharide flippase family protein [Fertoebacter nigrum]|uniref:Oligosaccharide flippase family protein n=1 Tax=Fertoeibacter niger TaxID=2656921 RepID=A0A8X8GXJ5_9RHOB|nr:oligosaccharide flippase family protein [Fertoeibacter niger]NUB44937.1 oligosaccharide flippase family protein [Fertoeibacter niger]